MVTQANYRTSDDYGYDVDPFVGAKYCATPVDTTQWVVMYPTATAFIRGMLSRALGNELSRLPGLEVLDQGTRDALLLQRKFSLEDCDKSECRFAMVRGLPGIDLMLEANIDAVGAGCTLGMVIKSVRKGSVVSSAFEKSSNCKPEDLLLAVQRVAQTIWPPRTSNAAAISDDPAGSRAALIDFINKGYIPLDMKVESMRKFVQKNGAASLQGLGGQGNVAITVSPKGSKIKDPQGKIVSAPWSTTLPTGRYEYEIGAPRRTTQNLLLYVPPGAEISESIALVRSPAFRVAVLIGTWAYPKSRSYEYGDPVWDGGFYDYLFKESLALRYSKQAMLSLSYDWYGFDLGYAIDSFENLSSHPPITYSGTSPLNVIRATRHVSQEGQARFHLDYWWDYFRFYGGPSLAYVEVSASEVLQQYSKNTVARKSPSKNTYGAGAGGAFAGFGFTRWVDVSAEIGVNFYLKPDTLDGEIVPHSRLLVGGAFLE